MTIWLLAIYLCTTTTYGETKSTVCQWGGPDNFYATQALCERGGKLGVSREPWLDDMAGVTRKMTNFRCSEAAVVDK